MKKRKTNLLKLLLGMALSIQMFLSTTTSVQADVVIDPVETATGISAGTLVIIILIVLVVAIILLTILRKLQGK